MQSTTSDEARARVRAMRERFPTFNIDQPWEDMSTYWGRVRYFMAITDVRKMFVPTAQLDAAAERIEQFVAGTVPPGVTEDELWSARKIWQAAYHPETREKIFWAFRFSAWMPVNVVVVAGMLLPNLSTAGSVFWQVANQCVNVAFNHANRSASNEMTTGQLLKGFGAAVASSAGVVIAMQKLLPRIVRSPRALEIGLKLGPFVAVLVAGMLNVGVIRFNEMTDGILVYDKDGNELGRSAKAGRDAVKKTIFTRLVNSSALLLLPIIAQEVVAKTVSSNPRILLATNVAAVTLGLVGFLPLSLAMYPPKVSSKAADLEEQFHALKGQDGAPIEDIYYNRGL